MIDGMLKPTRLDGEGWSELYAYDANGYLDTRTDKNNVVTDYICWVRGVPTKKLCYGKSEQKATFGNYDVNL